MYRLFPQPLRNALLPPYTLSQWKKFFFIHLPILHWLWTYRPKQLVGDIIAGITIGVTHVPQGIGFALLAGLPPVFGLYSSFVPVLVYSVLGTSRHISVGEFVAMSGFRVSSFIKKLSIIILLLIFNSHFPASHSNSNSIHSQFTPLHYHFQQAHFTTLFFLIIIIFTNTRVPIPPFSLQEHFLLWR